MIIRRPSSLGRDESVCARALAAAADGATRHNTEVKQDKVAAILVWSEVSPSLSGRFKCRRDSNEGILESAKVSMARGDAGVTLVGVETMRGHGGHGVKRIGCIQLTCYPSPSHPVTNVPYPDYHVPRTCTPLGAQHVLRLRISTSRPVGAPFARQSAQTPLVTSTLTTTTATTTRTDATLCTVAVLRHGVQYSAVTYALCVKRSTTIV